MLNIRNEQICCKRSSYVFTFVVTIWSKEHNLLDYIMPEIYLPAFASTWPHSLGVCLRTGGILNKTLFWKIILKITLKRFWCSVMALFTLINKVISKTMCLTNELLQGIWYMYNSCWYPNCSLANYLSMNCWRW